jgi:hypothetical protein
MDLTLRGGGDGHVMINLKRGLLRGWAVIAVVWIGLAGWREYTEKPWNWDWYYGSVRTEGECWDRLAKWPDGQPLSGREVYGDFWDKKLSTDSNMERNRWAEAIRQKLLECEAAAPIMQRMPVKLTRILSQPGWKESLPILLLPPFALLIAGYIIGWVVRGFRTQA